MDYKLKAITNNVDNDRIDLISSKQNDVEKNLNEEENVASSHICDKKVPVIFSTTHGVHLRTFDKNSTSNYMITFCDLERWVNLVFETFLMKIFLTSHIASQFFSHRIFERTISTQLD